MRKIREMISSILPVVGTVLVIVSVLLIEDFGWQIGLVLLGLLMIEVGVWKLAHPLLPDERRFLALRWEVDQFLDLVRQLNRSAVAARENQTLDDLRSIDEIKSEMIRSVDRMAAVSGRTNEELSASPQPIQPVI